MHGGTTGGNGGGGGATGGGPGPGAGGPPAGGGVGAGAGVPQVSPMSTFCAATYITAATKLQKELILGQLSPSESPVSSACLLTVMPPE